MKSFLSLLEEQFEMLNEAVNYEQMFDGLINTFPEGSDARKRVKDGIDKWIKRYKSKFKKSDVIIWFLRASKNALMYALYKEFARSFQNLNVMGFDQIRFDSEEEKDKTFEKFEPWFRKELKKFGEEAYTFTEITIFLNLAEHYLSLPIEKIQRFQWKNLPNEQIFDTFSKLEAEWKKETQELIEYDEDDNVVIELGNNFYWVSLDAAYCKKEGAAMGHCGNSPRSGTGDNIYSLRQLKTIGNKKYWHPFVTVTVDDDGKVWEVKGRGNHKPADRYIPYVVELFKNKRYVKGQMLGVGYLPENNLNFNEDFTEKQQEEILDANPNFEVVERPPIFLRLDEHGLVDYIYDEDFEFSDAANRYPETDEDWIDLEQNDPVIDISDYGKFFKYALEEHNNASDRRRDDNLQTLMNYVSGFYNSEDKQIITEEFEHLFSVQQDEFLDYLVEQVESETENHLEKTYDNFNWDRDNLEEDDYEEILDTFNENYEYDLEHYTEDAEKIIDFLKEVNKVVPVNDDMIFYDYSEEYYNKIVMKLLKMYVLKKKGVGGEPEEEDPNQMKFDFSKDVNESWKKIIKDLL